MNSALTHTSPTWPEPVAVGATMRAVVFRAFGPPDVLEQAVVATPCPGPGEVLVQVAAVSIGRLLDLAARSGKHPYAHFRLPHILGADHAGTVAAVGPDVDSVRVGDRVAVFPVITCGACPQCVAGREEACPSLSLIGTHRPGAYAEFCVAPARNVHRVPEGISPDMVAALALVGAVGANQLSQAGLRPGQWVLVQGAASALGSTTAALARHLGARVIATSRSADKREAPAAAGADVVLDATGADFAEQVSEATDGAGVDIVVDNLGDPAIWDASLDVLGRGGTVVTSGAFLGGKVRLDLLRLYSNCQRVLGVRTGNAAACTALWSEVDRGFRAVVDRTFPISRASDAHRYLEEDSNVGRVALVLGSEHWT
ncbi:alcohol dehydrogenase catalytic domain-containing protein [Streptomyces sp. AK08-02]|uniref:alcohol dehydrogenase catalytic domain-containing protein n=1 Tax=Streptomyces sp. AK08-02 TaxID=3028654 RepID=UPI0029B37B24|nr:zinc-binding dehydrogenase [Streptomyces sp. AK08-02]MDX3748153.1 zinc-binding dehydrogenase [Streptomyces sp. AK08-02]